MEEDSYFWIFGHPTLGHKNPQVISPQEMLKGVIVKILKLLNHFYAFYTSREELVIAHKYVSAPIHTHTHIYAHGQPTTIYMYTPAHTYTHASTHTYPYRDSLYTMINRVKVVHWT